MFGGFWNKIRSVIVLPGRRAPRPALPAALMPARSVFFFHSAGRLKDGSLAATHRSLGLLLFMNSFARGLKFGGAKSSPTATVNQPADCLTRLVRSPLGGLFLLLLRRRLSARRSSPALTYIRLDKVNDDDKLRSG